MSKIRLHRRLGWVGAAAVGLALVLAGAGLGTAPAEAQPPVDGKAIYLERCAFCHGEGGDGNGPVARYLDPRPRNFTLGQFRFRTTASGELPLRSDVLAIVNAGVRGTAMPSWEGVLSDAEVEAVVDYLTASFVPFWGSYEPPVVEIPDPPRVTAAMIEEGSRQFQELQCWKCHGNQGRGDGPSAPTLTDETDRPIRPADLTKAWRYKGGSDLVSIYTRFSTGMDGTPMPSFLEVIDEEQRWALAAYVQSLQSGEPTDENVLRAGFTTEALPTDPADERWAEADPTSFYLTGQAIVGPRWQTPGVDAISVRALYNSEALGLLIEWNDPTQNAETTGELDLAAGATYVDLEVLTPGQAVFPDGLAVQLPAEWSEGLRKPYFAWGQAGNPVDLWLWQNGTGVREYTATGLANELVGAESSTTSASAAWSEGHYQVVLTRPLATGEAGDLELTPGQFIPIAFQAWEGSRGEAGTRLSLSSWNNLVLERPTPASTYLYSAIAVLVVGAGEWWLYRKVRS